MHVVVGLGPGGIESWLVGLLRSCPGLRDRALICAIGRPLPEHEHYLPDVRELGVPVVRVPFTFAAGPFVSRLRRLLHGLRPSVVHSHMNYLSGFATLAARLAGVPVRVAHYHASFPTGHRGLLRRSYLSGARLLERLSATHVIGCSSTALESYGGPDWRTDPRRRVLYCGVDLAPFRIPLEKAEVRRALGLPDGAFVAAHIGSFTPQKNHEFLLSVFAELAARDDRALLLLVGDGPLRERIAHMAQERHVSDRVIFAGLRRDVPRILRGAVDVLLLPSLHEGLPLVTVQAQAAGVPVIVSDAVTPELEVVPALVRRLALDAPASEWADAVLRLRASHSDDALARVAASDFSMESSAEHLERLYDTALNS